jgi:chromosome partitioning protein
VECQLLSKSLKSLKDYYDFILIDCPPGMDLSFDLAFYSSDYALILMDGQPFAMQGLENILSEIRKVKDDDVSGDLNHTKSVKNKISYIESVTIKFDKEFERFEKKYTDKSSKQIIDRAKEYKDLMEKELRKLK